MVAASEARVHTLGGSGDTVGRAALEMFVPGDDRAYIGSHRAAAGPGPSDPDANGAVGLTTIRGVASALRMSSRRAVTAIALLYAGLAVPAGVPNSASAPRADTRPNVLIFITDDQRRGLGPMSQTKEYFKQQGRSFTRAFATTPLCCPSRASIMTGLYAHNHGVLDNLPDEAYLIRDDTLQAKLQARGYVSALFGKYLNKWPVRKAPPHFDHYATMKVGYEDAFWNVDGEFGQRDGYTTSILGKEAVEFVQSRQGRPEPWIMYVNPHAPHSPFTPEDGYEDEVER